MNLKDKLLESSLGPIAFGCAVIAFGIWLFDPNDTSRVCARGSCNSGASVSLSVIFVGSIFAFLGLRDLLAPLWKGINRPPFPYGSRKEHAERLRKMGVAEAQIKIELDKR